RLDRPVSGVTIFARTSKALTRMNQLFADRKVQKTYMAIVNSRPNDAGEKLVDYILKDSKKNKVRVFDTQRYKDAKKAELSYEMLAELGGHFLLKVKPKTGRPHQIRGQLAKIGCPIRGDKKYGSIHHQRLGGIHLHSYALSFEHPVKKEPITITSLPPNEQVWNMFNDYTKPDKKKGKK
ncbi:MAG: RluA family pseudouridine synthase, partial [Saprospiraceae bacterium]